MQHHNKKINEREKVKKGGRKEGRNYSNYSINYHALIHNIRKSAGCQWLMPIILATQETKIRRIMVQIHPGQIVHKSLSQK
jgi:hypothetical protein